MGTFSEKKIITERELRQLKPAEVEGTPRQKLYLDRQQLGFGVSVAASGRQSYIVLKRVRGRQVRFAFRKVGEGTLREARDRAAKLLVEMGDGINPVERRREEREAERRVEAKGVTLREALKLALSALKAKRRSQITGDGYRELLERYLKDWLDVPLASITRTDARKKHALLAVQVGQGKFAKGRKRRKGQGATVANAAFRVFRLCWNRAAREHEELGISPTVAVDWFVQQPRKSPISTSGLPDLWAKINAIENQVRRDWWRLALFTGLRRRSVCNIRITDVNLQARVLHIAHAKSGTPFDLPLSSYLVDMLRGRIEQNEALVAGNRRARQWVFPSTESASGQLAEPRDDTLPVTPHDARRLFITVAESIDASPYSIKLLVNHSLPKADVTAGYLAIELERLRPVQQAITDRMLVLCGVPPVAKVTSIASRRKRA